jgi:hypothetical protein
LSEVRGEKTTGVISRDDPPGFSFEHAFELVRAMGISVRGEHARMSGAADLPGFFGSELHQVRSHFFAVPGHQDFAVRFQKKLNAFPFVRDETSTGSCCFKNTARR